MKKSLLILSLFTSIITVSCQKELSDPTVTPPTNGGGGGGGSNGGGGGTGGASIVGNWKFVSMSATTQAIAQVSVAGMTIKSVTTSDYTSTNNVGTVTITSSTISSNGIGYDLAFTAHSTTYQNGVSAGTYDQPYSYSVPPTSGVSNYTQVNADSIYMTAQGMGQGYHLALNGNILKMTTYIVKDTTVDISGMPAQMHESATQVSTLQKQ